MSQMTAISQVHAHNGIARGQQSKENCHICLCTGMRLYICIIAAKQLFGTISCQIFYHIHALTSAIISFSRITFCIFVGQGASHSSHNCFTYPVFRSNQFNVTVLSFLLLNNSLCNLLIYCTYFVQ